MKTQHTATGGKTHRFEAIGAIIRTDGRVCLDIREPWRPGLKQLTHFSHVIVLWWADRHDNEKSRARLQTRPPYARDKTTGVFACRSEYRPNPIALTTCKILEVDEKKGKIRVADIDAFDGTQILDLKPYFPVCDRVRNVRIPEWLAGWPEWLPDRGLGLEY